MLKELLNSSLLLGSMIQGKFFFQDQYSSCFKNFRSNFFLFRVRVEPEHTVLKLRIGHKRDHVLKLGGNNPIMEEEQLGPSLKKPNKNWGLGENFGLYTYGLELTQR